MINKVTTSSTITISICAYIMDMTTNGVVITDPITFVQTNKEKLMSTKEDKESKEPDYDEDKDQLEEKQGKEIGEQETTNHVFLILG